MGYTESPWRPQGVWKLLSTAGPGKPIIPDTSHSCLALGPGLSGTARQWAGTLTALLRLLA